MNKLLGPIGCISNRMQIICLETKLFYEYIKSLIPTCIKRNKVLKLDLAYM